MAARQLFDEFVSRGESGLQQAIDDQREETLFLDFKRGGEHSQGKQTGTGKLTPEDRNNLAKIISGFANSDGGIAVWGVDCRKVGGDAPDVASALMPIANVRRFLTDLLSETNAVASGAEGVLHELVPCTVNPSDGYVITYVPKGESAPVMALAKDMNCYWFRSGDSFLRMPPFMVADRFSRRPQPKLVLDTHCVINPGDAWWKFRVDLAASSVGVGSAFYAAAGFGIETPGGIEKVHFDFNRDLVCQNKHNMFPPEMFWTSAERSRNFDVSGFFNTAAGQAIHPGSTLSFGNILIDAPRVAIRGSLCRITYELYCEGYSVKGTKDITINDFQR